MLGTTLSILGGIGGSAISSALSYGQAKKIQQRQFEFQEKMSNTAHQREVQDLMKAGLNPILSATGGSGASTPSGGITSPSTPDIGNTINQGISNAKQISMMKTEKENIKSQTELNNKTAETEEAKKLNFEQNTALQNAQTAGQLIENSYLPQKLKNELKEQLSRVELNFAGASAKQMDAISNRITAKANEIERKAQAKYTNERARGYSESKTDFKGIHAGKFGEWGWGTGQSSKTW